MDSPRYRHELKYEISYGDYLCIRQRVRGVMKSDEHAVDGKYRIRSVYFDNISDKALREKVNGNQLREKFRIRYYGDDFSRITLEKKIKHDNLCMKVGAGLTLEECWKILRGDTEFMRSHPESLVQELYCKMKSQLLRPRVLVSYTREPYVFAAGNVRVTFDMDIRTTLWHPGFFEDIVFDIPAGETPSNVIMEVKFDDFLPEVIQHVIQAPGVRQQAFSKYGVCRRFG